MRGGTDPNENGRIRAVGSFVISRRNGSFRLGRRSGPGSFVATTRASPGPANSPDRWFAEIVEVRRHMVVAYAIVASSPGGRCS